MHGNHLVSWQLLGYDSTTLSALIWKKIPGFQRADLQSPGAYNYISIFINLNDEDLETGQVVYVEKRSNLFSSNLALMKSFTKYLNGKFMNFKIGINPIPDDIRDFWTEIQGKKVAKLELEYSPPNFFDHDNSLAEEAAKARQIYNAETTRITLINNDTGGLTISPQDPTVNEALSYIQHGGGEVKAIGHGNNTLYDSGDDKHIKTIRNIDLGLDLAQIDTKDVKQVENVLRIIDKLKELS